MRTNSPFALADRYIELRTRWNPVSWGDQMIQMNELIVTPFITIVLLMLEKLDFLTLFTTTLRTVQTWMEWVEYNDLRFQMQQMYLVTMKTGGPHIVTNDPKYMPYVYADAVVRDGMRRPDPVPVRR